MIRTLDNLLKKHRDQLPPEPFGGVRLRLSEKYETTLAKELENQTTISAIVETMEEARLQIENLPILHQDFSAFRGGIQRTYSRGRRGLRCAYAKPRSDHFHEWRKRVKYLWYQLEILEDLWPNVLSQLAEELHTLSEYLGDDHDLAVLRSTILDTSADFKNENELLLLVQLIDHERLGLEALARPLGERLYFDPPKVFTSRLETFWRAWKAEASEQQSELIQRIQDRSPAYLRLDQDLLTTAEMAALLEISTWRVRKLIYDQKLPAEKVGAIWIIKAELSLPPDDIPEITDDVLLSTREAANQMNLPLYKIWKMIQLQQIPATRVGRYWIIQEADLSEILEDSNI
jgi:excisionase family DNA binding protein